jgi:hypothetical protein
MGGTRVCDPQHCSLKRLNLRALPVTDVADPRPAFLAFCPLWRLERPARPASAPVAVLNLES